VQTINLAFICLSSDTKIFSVWHFWQKVGNSSVNPWMYINILLDTLLANPIMTTSSSHQ